MSLATRIAQEFNNVRSHISGITATHLLGGNLSVSNEVITNGFSTTLYTGNGGTQSINTGVDMATQWGNDASEMFGGLSWIKSRSAATNNYFVDTVRGATKDIYSNATTAEITEATGLTSFTSTGFNLGTLAGMNTNLATYVSWNFQTTHRTTGVTNHGKAFTEHYNPFTGFTIIKYEGSGLAGHEIPHSLGRKLAFANFKNLTTVQDWLTYYGTDNMYMAQNLTIAGTTSTVWSNQTDNAFKFDSAGAHFNQASSQYIMYGWANSYLDETNKLIGNYEVGVYQGTGAAGNKVTTRGKPAWIMLKYTSGADGWYIFDNQRSDKNLSVHTSNIEGSEDTLDFLSDGFVLKVTSPSVNVSGGQYLYMVVYDNDSGSGKSKYPKATDTTQLNLNALVPYPNGIDTKGSKVSISYKNETITLSNALVQGKNYVASLNDGTYVAKQYNPMYGSLRNRVIAGENPDYFDLGLQKWFSTTGNGEKVVNGDFNNGTTGWVGDTSVGTVTIFSNVNSTLQVTRASSGGWSLGEPYQILTLVKGKRYRLKAIIGTNPCSVSISTIVGIPNICQYSASTSGMLDVDFIAQDNTIYLKFLPDNYNTTCTISYISIFELTPTIGAEIQPRNYLNHIVHADQNGQVTYVEELPKIEYKNVIKANEYRGKNACTVFGSIDISTTPITEYEVYGIKSIIRTGTGKARIYFKEPMDNLGYSFKSNAFYTAGNEGNIVCFTGKTLDYIDVIIGVPGTAGSTTLTPKNNTIDFEIIGGKN